MTATEYKKETSPFNDNEALIIKLAKERINNFLTEAVPYTIKDAIDQGHIVLSGLCMSHFFIPTTKSTVTSISGVCLNSADAATWAKFFGDNHVSDWETYIETRKANTAFVDTPILYRNLFSRVLCIDLAGYRTPDSKIETNLTELKLFLGTHKMATRDDVVRIQRDNIPKVSYTGGKLYITEQAYRDIIKP